MTLRLSLCMAMNKHLSEHTLSGYHLPAETAPAFARTNAQTIAQRVALLRELLPDVRAIGELCCGDCARQWTAYRQAFPDVSYRGLDIAPHIVAANQAQGIACTCGDVLDPATLRQFLACDVLFFGPPLSQNCDGHNLLAFTKSPFVCRLYAPLGRRAINTPSASVQIRQRWDVQRLKRKRTPHGPMSTCACLL